MRPWKTQAGNGPEHIHSSTSTGTLPNYSDDYISPLNDRQMQCVHTKTRKISQKSQLSTMKHGAGDAMLVGFAIPPTMSDKV